MKNTALALTAECLIVCPDSLVCLVCQAALSSRGVINQGGRPEWLTLCLVSAYCFPGLPSPTSSHMSSPSASRNSLEAAFSRLELFRLCMHNMLEKDGPAYQEIQQTRLRRCIAKGCCCCEEASSVTLCNLVMKLLGKRSIYPCRDSIRMTLHTNCIAKPRDGGCEESCLSSEAIVPSSPRAPTRGTRGAPTALMDFALLTTASKALLILDWEQGSVAKDVVLREESRLEFRSFCRVFLIAQNESEEYLTR